MPWTSFTKASLPRKRKGLATQCLPGNLSKRLQVHLGQPQTAFLDPSAHQVKRMEHVATHCVKIRTKHKGVTLGQAQEEKLSCKRQLPVPFLPLPFLSQASKPLYQYHTLLSMHYYTKAFVRTLSCHHARFCLSKDFLLGKTRWQCKSVPHWRAYTICLFFYHNDCLFPIEQLIHADGYHHEESVQFSPR